MEYRDPPLCVTDSIATRLSVGTSAPGLSYRQQRRFDVTTALTLGTLGADCVVVLGLQFWPRAGQVISRYTPVITPTPHPRLDIGTTTCLCNDAARLLHLDAEKLHGTVHCLYSSQ
jgi:hypothetical protein